MRHILLALTLLASLPSWSQTVAAIEVPIRILPLEVVVNGVTGGLWPVLDRAGAFHVPEEAFASWRLARPEDVTWVDYRGLRYGALASLPGGEARLDAASGLLHVSVSTTAFAATRLGRKADEVRERDPTIPSGFASYELSLDFARERGGGHSRSLGLASEVGYSTNAGVLTTSFIGRDLDSPRSRQRGLTRLGSTFRRDLPAQRLTVSLGDGATRAGYLGQPAYFGGLQIGTNFALTPGFHRNPIPVINGETRAPSTVQLYVNNVLRQTTSVPSGPFTLDNVPAVTGNGNVSVVVRDLLGRETVITQPFIVTADLLAPGLNDWSVEAGKLRLGLGTSSNDYGDAFVAGLWRRGISQHLTVEARGERTADLTSGAAAAVVALGGQLVGRAGAGGSRDTLRGAGRRWTAGLDWQGVSRSFLFAAEGTSRRYLDLGQSRTTPPVRTQFSGQATFELGRFGRIGAGLVTQQPYEAARVSVLTLSHHLQTRQRWLVGTTLSRATGPSTTGYNIALSLNVPLERGTAVALTGQWRSGQFDSTISAARPPEGPLGTGWRLMTTHQQYLRSEAGIYRYGPYGLLSGEISASRDQVNLRAGASGSLLLAGGKFAALQRHDTSAVLVEVPGYAGVGVGLDGRVSDTTDSNGLALIAGLTAYQGNAVQLAANDLPITAEIDNIEQTTVPAARSVTRVVFKVRGGRGAMVRVVLADGQPAPAGAAIRIAGEERDFLVSRRGEAYVTGLKDANALALHWKGKSCPLAVKLPPGKADDIARVGPLSCMEVER